jgi:cytochrome c biogenesis protein CcdA
MLLALIFFAGVLHGLGPDHLAAITALSAVGGGARRLVFFSVRFALGHTLVIAAAGLAAHFGRDLLPAGWGARMDEIAGALLVLAGVGLLVAVLLGKLSLHAHAHAHDGSEHRHFHLHMFARASHRHGHGRLATALGALFALGGARGLLAVVPIATSETLAISALRIAAFTAGIAAAMVAYGLLASPALRWSEARSLGSARLAAVMTSLFCIVAGALTIIHWNG